jgi:hypothetical protein
LACGLRGSLRGVRMDAWGFSKSLGSVILGESILHRLKLQIIWYDGIILIIIIMIIIIIIIIITRSQSED